MVLGCCSLLDLRRIEDQSLNMDRIDVSTMSHEELRGYTAAMSGDAIGMFTTCVVSTFLLCCEGGSDGWGRRSWGELWAPTGRQHPHPSALIHYSPLPLPSHSNLILPPPPPDTQAQKC